MVFALSLGAALLIGVGDVFGSLAGRQGRVLAVTLWVILTSTFPVVLIALAVGGTPRTLDYFLGGVAGVAGGIGLLSLYAGYSRTAVGVVAPIAAVIGAVLPVAVGISVGDRAGPLALLGIAFGVLGIGLVGWKPDFGAAASPKTAVAFGLTAGLSFGVMAAVLGLTDAAAGVMPLIPTRILSALALVAIAGAARLPLMPVRPSWKFIPGATICSAAGIAMFVLAAQQNLTIAGLLLQMAYAVSALLAILIFHERPTRWQRIGFAAAITALVLIGVG